jgi:uncharacterized membrane protein
MKKIRLISGLVVLVIVLALLSVPGAVLAQGTPQAAAPSDSVVLTTDFPSVDGFASDTFKYSLNIEYTGNVSRVFNLKVTAPQNWTVTINPMEDTSKIISSVSFDASPAPSTQYLQVSATYTNMPLPDPGDYKINIQAMSPDNLVSSIDLTARVTAKYTLTANPADNLYSLKVGAGHDNLYPVVVTNTGTAPIEDIEFSADSIEGWNITFSQEKIDSLASQDSQTINVNIKPASKTIAGDYMLNIYVNGTQASADKMSVRVTVETPSIWGWVGIIIIVIVVLGLILVFMRFGRR